MDFTFYFGNDILHKFSDSQSLIFSFFSITVLILAMLMMLGTIVDYQHRKNSQQALDQQLDPAKTTQGKKFFRKAPENTPALKKMLQSDSILHVYVTYIYFYIWVN